MAVGMFDVAVSGEDEQRIQKQAQQDKIHAAIYDVRERHGEWLFGARDIDGFNDRAKLAHVSICQTIEPHLHARTGVHRRVMKALEREWRQRQAAVTEDSIGNTIDTSISNSMAGPKGMKTPRMPRQHVQGPQLEGRRIAAPGVPPPPAPGPQQGNSAPVMPSGEFPPGANDSGGYSDAGGLAPGQRGAGRRYYADGPSVEEDPERAHAIFDRANELVDEVSGFGPDMMPQDPMGGMPPEAPPDQFAPPQPDPQPDPQQLDPALLQARRRQARGVECPQCGKYLHDEIDRAGHQHGADGQEYNADPQYGFESRGDYQQRHACYPGCHENEAHAKKFHKEKESRRYYADYGSDSDARSGGGEAHQLDPIQRSMNQDQHGSGEGGLSSIYSSPGGGFESGGGSISPGGPLGGGNMKTAPGLQSGPPGTGTYGPSGGTMNNPPGFGTESGGGIAKMGPQYSGGGGTASPMTPGWIGHGSRYAADDHPELHTNITYAPHTGEELHGSGDFEAYKDSVDQGAPEKVNRDFVPGSHDLEHHPDVHHNFDPGYKEASEYTRISRMLYADASAPPGMPAMPDMSGGAAASGSQAPMGQGGNPTAAEVAPPPTAATESPAAGAQPPASPMMPMASREYQIISAMLRQGAGYDPVTPAGQYPNTGPAGGKNTTTGGPGAGGGPFSNVPGVDAEPVPGHFGMLRRYADRNYLQQADEALTKVLNEKAEEFQNTIAPLQAALQTIQQAEALTNPLNVSPPAGTVNVLPQQEGAQAPQGGGGLGADPAAAGLAAQPQQQMQARRRRPLA